MFIDASALVAIIAGESDGETLARQLDAAEERLHRADCDTAEIGGLAIDAFERFGRGRHPAALNRGDCFAYACARSLGVPLLFKGEDFAKTDIRVV